LCVAFAFDHFSMDGANSAEQRQTGQTAQKQAILQHSLFSFLGYGLLV